MPSTISIGFIAAFLLSSTAFAQTAYVGNNSEYLISTVNENAGALGKVSRAGLYGSSLSVSADGRMAAVATRDIFGGTTPGVNLVDLTTGTITTPFTAIPSPSYPLISPDGSYVIMDSYVPNVGLVEGSTSTGAVLASVPTNGLIPLLITPDSSGIYTDTELGLSVLDSKTLTAKATISNLFPVAVALSNDGTRLYAATGFSRNSSTILSIVDTASNTVLATVPATNPKLGRIMGLTLSPDNKTAYIAAEYALIEVSTETASVTGYIPAPPGGLSGSVAASADGKSVFACRPESAYPQPGYFLFDIAQGTATVTSQGGYATALFQASPTQPIFLLNLPSETVVENVTGGTVTTTIGSTLGVESLSVSASGNRVAGVRALGHNTYLDVVSVIDTASHKKVGEFTFPPVTGPGITPSSIAVSSDGSLGYMVESESVNNTFSAQIYALLLPEGTVQSSFPIAAVSANTVAIAPDGSRLYLDGVCAVTLATQALQCAPPYNGNPNVTAVPGPATVSPDGEAIYVSGLAHVEERFFPVLDELDSATMTLHRGLGLTKDPRFRVSGCLAPAVGRNSLYLACTRLTKTQTVLGTILRIDLTDFSIAAAQYPNYIPQGIAVTPDGSQVLVTGSNYGTQLFDGTTLAYTGSIGGGIQSGIVIAPQ